MSPAFNSYLTCSTMVALPSPQEAIRFDQVAPVLRCVPMAY
jgi:hypothetical protein